MFLLLGALCLVSAYFLFHNQLKSVWQQLHDMQIGRLVPASGDISKRGVQVGLHISFEIKANKFFGQSGGMPQQCCNTAALLWHGITLQLHGLGLHTSCSFCDSVTAQLFLQETPEIGSMEWKVGLLSINNFNVKLCGKYASIHLSQWHPGRNNMWWTLQCICDWNTWSVDAYS